MIHKYTLDASIENNLEKQGKIFDNFFSLYTYVYQLIQAEHGIYLIHVINRNTGWKTCKLYSACAALCNTDRKYLRNTFQHRLYMTKQSFILFKLNWWFFTHKFWLILISNHFIYLFDFLMSNATTMHGKNLISTTNYLLQHFAFSVCMNMWKICFLFQITSQALQLSNFRRKTEHFTGIIYVKICIPNGWIHDQTGKL